MSICYTSNLKRNQLQSQCLTGRKEPVTGCDQATCSFFRRIFPITYFQRIFLCKYFFKLLWLSCLEKPYSKTSLLKCFKSPAFVMYLTFLLWLYGTWTSPWMFPETLLEHCMWKVLFISLICQVFTVLAGLHLRNCKSVFEKYCNCFRRA